MSNFPDFIIGGAAKSGTTSLSRYLNGHSKVWLPPQELNFFPFCEKKPGYTVLQRPIVSDFEIYCSYFQTNGSVVKGEKSVSYLYKGLYSQTIKNLLSYHPSGKNVKLIFMLRDPVDRAWSQYIHNLNIYETLTFQEAVDAWPERNRRSWVPAFDYLGAGLYYDALQSYLLHFQHVKVYLFEDLLKNKDRLLEDIFDFLEVDKQLPVNRGIRYNPSSVPINKGSSFLYSMVARNPVTRALKNRISADNQVKVKSMVTSFTHKKPELMEEIRHQILPYFRTDIEKLESLIQRDLGHWLT